MPSLSHRALPLRLSHRSFSSCCRRPASLHLDSNDKEAFADVVPEYPYGPAKWYKQSNLGLYAGQRIQFGNIIGPKSKTKHRRSWAVNVQTKRLWSIALNRFVQVRVSNRALRTIEKCGGLDPYLLGDKPARIKELGVSGWFLRWAIMQTGSVKRMYREERKRLGLPKKSEEEEEREVQAEMEQVMGKPVETSASAPLDSETLPTDDAFTIEDPPNLPAIKFRVGYRRHVALTEKGWVRTRPAPETLVKQFAQEKLQMAERVQDRERQMEEFEKALDASVASSGALASPDARVVLRRRAARATSQLKSSMKQMNKLTDEKKLETTRRQKLQRELQELASRPLLERPTPEEERQTRELTRTTKKNLNGAQRALERNKKHTTALEAKIPSKEIAQKEALDALALSTLGQEETRRDMLTRARQHILAWARGGLEYQAKLKLGRGRMRAAGIPRRMTDSKGRPMGRKQEREVKAKMIKRGPNAKMIRVKSRLAAIPRRKRNLEGKSANGPRDGKVKAEA